MFRNICKPFKDSYELRPLLINRLTVTQFEVISKNFTFIKIKWKIFKENKLFTVIAGNMIESRL